MLRVGYPTTFAAELLRDFPDDVDLIAIPEDADCEIEIDVWIPDFYPARARRQWTHLRGVRLVLSPLAGVEWLPALVGPGVTICNAHGAHNVATAEWVVGAILALLKQFPFYLEVQKSQQWKRRFEAGARYAAMTGDARAIYPPSCWRSLPASPCCLSVTGPSAKRSNACSRRFASISCAWRAGRAPIPRSMP